MIHDSGLGRVTDVGEQAGEPAYNPFTGEGYDPKVAESNFIGFMEDLYLRDEQGRVRFERVPTLPEMVQTIHDAEMNVVLELDFKDQAAIEPAYWALKSLRRVRKRNPVVLHPGLRTCIPHGDGSACIAKSLCEDQLYHLC